MAFFSKTTLTGNGTTTDFMIPFSYLVQKHVTVKVNTVVQVVDTDYSIDEQTKRVVFVTAPPSGATIDIIRKTPRETANIVVDFTTGSPLGETDLDNSVLQNLFIAQELADELANIQATGTVGFTGSPGPPGPQGSQGASFDVDASGTLAARDAHDGAAAGFAYLDTESGNLYVKNSATSGDWSDPIPFGKGEPGPGIVFRGDWDNTTAYFGTANRRDVVLSGGAYYITLDIGGSFTGAATSDTTKWDSFGAQFDAVATDFLLAQDATLYRGLVVGDDGSTQGFIRSGGAVDLDNGVGFYMAHNGKVRFGDPAADHIKWDGTTLAVKGSLTIDGGSGWENLSDRPTHLRHINSTEGSKLATVDSHSDRTVSALHAIVSLYQGGINMYGASGFIRAGKTTFSSTAEGFFLGRTGTNKVGFHIGNGSTFLKYDTDATTPLQLGGISLDVNTINVNPQLPATANEGGQVNLKGEGSNSDIFLDNVGGTLAADGAAGFRAFTPQSVWAEIGKHAFHLDPDNETNSSPKLTVSGTQVIGPQEDAISDPGSTTSANNTAIIDILGALRNHGIIAT